MYNNTPSGYWRTLCLFLLTALSQSVHADISGKVFRDYNANGVLDTGSTEAGMAGVTVNAYAADDPPGTPSATANSGVDGNYTLTGLSAGADYRLEFSWSESWLKPGVGGNTSVQFATDGATGVDIAVSNPGDYCQADPIISTTHFWPLEQNTADPTLVGFRYSNGVTSPSGEHYKVSSWQDASPYTFGESQQLGAIFGIAWNRSAQYVYSAAMKEQYVGFGPGGRGQIYRTKINPADGSVVSTPESWVNVETDLGFPVCGSHNDLAAAGYSDAEFDQVGKCSLGDLEISDDDQSLFVTNLSTRQVVEIATADGSKLNTFDFPLNAADCPNNSTDAIYPFGLAYKDGKLFAGGVCSAEESGDADDLRVFVYRLDDPAGDTWTRVIHFNPGEVRENQYFPGETSWEAWRNVWSDAGGYYQGYESPMLADIEFYGDDMVLGLRDRTGDQLADDIIINGTTINGVAVRGDVVCATYDAATESYSPETTAPNACGGRVASGAGRGDGNGEFFWGDGNSADNSHEETSMGSLVIFGGSNLVMGAVNPSYAIGATSTANSGGVIWLDNENGAAEKVYYLYSGSDNNNSKGNGLGDLEALCDPAPIEVGNRVWLDADGDGIQDAGEDGIGGVEVDLMCGGNYANATTDSNGQFFFSNAAGGNASFMMAGQSCTISIESGQAAIQDYSLTLQDADGKTDNDAIMDIRDSDAVVFGSKAQVTFTVGNAGENNHSLDIGFTEAVCSLEAPVVNASCDDSGTASDPSDDTFSYTINLNGTNTGASYSISGGDTQSGVSYGSEQGPFGSFPISGGDISLTLTDVNDAACTLADVAITAPATCSDQAPPRTPLPVVSASCSATDSDLSIPSYVFGHQIEGDHKDKAALVSFAYADVNDPLASLAKASQIGTTWGLAHHEASNTLYAAAMMKRHAGFGPGGPGAIYQVHAGTDGELGTADDALGTLATLSAGTDPHPATAAGNWFHDAASFDAVGKLALGDIDLAADGSALYAINLYDRKLYTVPLSSATPPVAGSPTSTALPVPGDCPLDPATPGGEMNLNVRPFAVKVNGDRLYVGMTCTAQSTGNAADLRAYVYEYDGTDFLQVLNLPLNYARGTDTGMSLDWKPWTADFFQTAPLPADNAYRVGAQPWLTDIEFDGGDMVLGFRDRTGDQLGRFAGSTDTNDSNMYTALAYGDILRACGNSDGYWTLESNGSCGSVSTSGVGNGIGPDNGEFYVGDKGIHINSSSGALALLGDSGEIVTTQMDAVEAVTTGVRWLSNSDGEALRGKTIAIGGLTNEGFGKGNGLGDLEILCATPVAVDVELTKTADKSSALRGETLVYTLTARNTSANDATGVQVTDVLPEGVSHVSDTGAGAYDPVTGVWDVGGLGAGASTTLNITVMVD